MRAGGGAVLARVVGAMATVAVAVALAAGCDTSPRQQPAPRAARPAAAVAVEPAPAAAEPAEPAVAAPAPAAAQPPGDGLTDADLPVETDFEAAAEAEITPQTYKDELARLAAEIAAAAD